MPPDIHSYITFGVAFLITLSLGLCFVVFKFTEHRRRRTAVQETVSHIMGGSSNEAFFNLLGEASRRLALLNNEDPGPGTGVQEAVKPEIPTGPDEVWVRHVPGTKPESTRTLTWHCPHCGHGHPTAITRGGNWSWSPRVCHRCNMRMQQFRPPIQKTEDDGVILRLYFVKKEPTRAGFDRLGMLLDDS